MSILPNIAPIQPAQTVQPLQMDAFSSAMNAASTALNGGPDAIGQSLLSGVDSFSAHETRFRDTVEQAINPAPTQSETDPETPRPLTTAQAMQEGEKLQQKSMGVMMQTYSFALEATLVSNAATTFTSSVNTLIKTQ